MLLIGVALAQIYLALADDLLAWKGGGFGMFARLDGVEFREVRATDAGGRRIEIPIEAYAEERHSKIYPSRASLRGLESELQSLGYPPLAIEVWRTRFETQALRPRRERIAGLAPRIEPDR